MFIRIVVVRIVLVLGSLLLPAMVAAKDVKITEYLPEVKFTANGKRYTIERIQNENNDLTGSFAKTSRKCPPFCIHPMEVAPGVITVGELELMEFLKNKVEKGSGILIDSRVESFYTKGTIPGSVNIPFTTLTASDKDPGFRQAMAQLGVMTGETVNWSNSVHRTVDELGDNTRKLAWDFSRAKDILLFCNGPWCDQSPRAILALLHIGYPSNKIYYYRGGMQNWLSVGLSVEIPSPLARNH